MTCFLRTPSSTVGLVVKRFSTELISDDGKVQLRRYSAPFSKAANQDTLVLHVQTFSNAHATQLAKVFRQSQLDSLNGKGDSKVLWAERRIAYEVFLRSFDVVTDMTVVAPVFRLRFGIITGLINKDKGEVSGSPGFSTILSEWITYEDNRFLDSSGMNWSLPVLGSGSQVR